MELHLAPDGSEWAHELGVEYHDAEHEHAWNACKELVAFITACRDALVQGSKLQEVTEDRQVPRGF